MTMARNMILDAEIFTAKLSDIQKIKTIKPASNTVIYDQQGNLISEQYNQYQVYTKFEDFPETIKQSILAIEDRNFFRHSGIDILAIARAALSYLKDSHNSVIKQGGSTITQQVVKNILLTNEKTIERKIREIILSLYLEQVMTKEEIFEIYCNEMFLGNGSIGVTAAAKRYFDKDLKDISIDEAAFIAGLFQSPSKYNPFKNPDLAKKRQKIVLRALYANGNLNKKSYLKLRDQTLAYSPYQSLHGKHAPYYVDYILQEATKLLEQKNISIKDSGLKIYTNLDQSLQNAVETTFKESSDLFKKMDDHQKEILEDDEGSQAAMLVMDRRDGRILALKGGKDFEISQFNRAINAKRAPGSVFKTITYALALQNGHQWNDQHYVSPVTIGNYRPRSSYYRLFSQTTLLEAFYESINSPAVTIGNEMGIKNVLKFAKKLGVNTELKQETATLLGSSEITMLDLARVYSVFANQGKKVEPYGISRIENAQGDIIYEANPEKKQVLSQVTTELMHEGLKQVVARGTAYKARYLNGFAAGKTGTSNQSKDNWFCGYTDDLVIISWMGHDKQLPYKGYISASNTATPLWARFAQKSQKILKTKRLSEPSKVKVATVSPKFGHLDENGIPMYFVSDLYPEKDYSDLIKLEQGKNIRMDFDEF